MKREIRDAVVVITGASSGIGRATALEFAKRGAVVVLTARQTQPLVELERECQNYGVQTLVFSADVTEETAVQELARRTIETFGRIDVWVNNAAVSLFGKFEEIPPEEFRQVIETDLFGYIHGARAVLPYFREQDHGVLINVCSQVGTAAIPYLSAYVTAKFAIRGFSESLREELLGTGIEVCTLFPASIDTPLFQHAANFSGRAIKPMWPVYRAETVAKAIVRLARSPKREAYAGKMGKLASVFHTAAPHWYECITSRMVPKNHFQDRLVPPSSGNLYHSMPQFNSISGGWSEQLNLRSTRLAVAGVGALTAGVLTLAFLRQRQNGKNRKRRGRFFQSA